MRRKHYTSCQRRMCSKPLDGPSKPASPNECPCRNVAVDDTCLPRMKQDNTMIRRIANSFQTEGGALTRGFQIKGGALTRGLHTEDQPFTRADPHALVLIEPRMYSQVLPKIQAFKVDILYIFHLSHRQCSSLSDTMTMPERGPILHI